MFVVSVQDKDAVQGALEHGIDLVVLTGIAKHHAQEVACIAQVVLGVHEWLANAVFVGHGHEGGHLGDQANGGDFAVFGVVDVGAVMVEGRQAADQAGEHGHGVGVTAKPTQEKLHLLVHHGVVGDQVGEVGFLFGVRQLAVQQQVAGFQKVALGRQLLDGVAPVQQLAFVAIDVGDGRLARRGGQKARVIGEHAGLAVQLADIDHVGADAALIHRHVNAGLTVAERQGGFVICNFHGVIPRQGRERKWQLWPWRASFAAQP